MDVVEPAPSICLFYHDEIFITKRIEQYRYYEQNKHKICNQCGENNIGNIKQHQKDKQCHLSTNKKLYPTLICACSLCMQRYNIYIKTQELITLQQEYQQAKQNCINKLPILAQVKMEQWWDTIHAQKPSIHLQQQQQQFNIFYQQQQFYNDLSILGSICQQKESYVFKKQNEVTNEQLKMQSMGLSSKLSNENYDDFVIKNIAQYVFNIIIN